MLTADGPAEEPKQYQHPFLGLFLEYTWCARCQVVWYTQEWLSPSVGEWRCPDPDCPGDLNDAWRWERVIYVQPAYPRTPAVGDYYPLDSVAVSTRSTYQRDFESR